MSAVRTFRRRFEKVIRKTRSRIQSNGISAARLQYSQDSIKRSASANQNTSLFVLDENPIK
ncbi:MAG: hypothetical protein DMG15_22380 [Acidobacteria bacterium]|nr:MAG: hypothetical protein DMG16_22650 [Acidobacteriota bacterium]PYS09937.1 MAG: hypothetical protein DMG15_22380 [Acidobacteriota bacterium]